MLKLWPALILVALMMEGCASPAAPTSMVATPALPADRVQASPLARGIEVGAVTGGEPTSPLWVSKVGNGEFGEALRRSLAGAGLLAAAPGDARYELRANLLTLSQPMFGTDFTVKSTVKYTLTERTTARVVYDEMISADYTAAFGDHLIGVERLRLANEGSIRRNIERAIGDMVNRVMPSAAPRTPRVMPRARTGS